MKRMIRIGTRDSALAVWQAEFIRQKIEKNFPDIVCEIVTMKTTGDRILDRPLDSAGGKGLFVKELDAALLRGETDLSVHSLKDMPMEIPENLPVLACSVREDPRDALIVKKGLGEGSLQSVGTSSRRREVQLRQLYPDISIVPIRGNVQTRLNKLEKGVCDSTVLAAAGLKRLGKESVITRVFSTAEMIPAAGQGILAVQGRAGENYDFLRCINCERSEAAALAERAFVKELDGGCTAPIAAYADVTENRILLTGLYFSNETGCRIGRIQGSRDEGTELGKRLAAELKEG